MVALYLDKLNQHMERLLLDLCPDDVDMRFLQPTLGKQGSLGDARVFLVTNYLVSKEIIDKSPNLQLIQRTGVGVDNVDLAYAREKGIPVSISKGFNSSSVAELAILLMMALYRRIVPLDALTKKGEWHTWTHRHESYELLGKTVGILGAGAIGREVIKRVKAFGTTVVYYDACRLDPALEEELGIAYMPFGELISASDILTIHLPWLPETQGMIGEEEFRRMKPNAILINTARGPIVDQGALVAALKSGAIAGAACDVFMSEPADPKDPLFSLEGVNLITTPHLGAATYDNYHRVYSFCIDNIHRIARGEAPAFTV